MDQTLPTEFLLRIGRELSCVPSRARKIPPGLDFIPSSGETSTRRLHVKDERGTQPTCRWLNAITPYRMVVSLAYVPFWHKAIDTSEAHGLLDVPFPEHETARYACLVRSFALHFEPR